MLFKAMKVVGVVGTLTAMALHKDKLPSLPPASLGLPVQAGLPFAPQGSAPGIADLTPALIPGLLAGIQGSVGNSALPDLGPFTPGRSQEPSPAAVPKTLADNWRDAPEETRRRIATLLAHKGSRMLLADRTDTGM